MMKYQLVIQWPVHAGLDLDRLIEIEDGLTDDLSSAHDVDGHDVGAEQMNIFILTDDPSALFTEIKDLLKGTREWSQARIAYRDTSGEAYSILWPPNLGNFSIK